MPTCAEAFATHVRRFSLKERLQNSDGTTIDLSLGNAELSKILDRASFIVPACEGNVAPPANLHSTQAQRAALPQRPRVVGQPVWSAKPSQTALRSRPPCACHMGEKVSSAHGVRNLSNPRHKRAVDLMKSLLGKGGTMDFLVHQWGIRRTRKSVLPINQQPARRLKPPHGD